MGDEAQSQRKSNEGNQRVEEEVAFLCNEIRGLSNNGISVTFGELMGNDRIVGTLEAPFGTLKAARKRKLISFEGELLLVGKDDAVVISLNQSSPEETQASASPNAGQAETAPAAAAEASPQEASRADLEQSSSPEVGGELASEAPPKAQDLGSEEQHLLQPEAEAEQQPEAEAEQQPEAKAEQHAEAKAEPAAVEAATEASTVEAEAAAVDVALPAETAPSAKADETAPAASEQDLAEGRKWQPVDTSYIDRRTADPNNLAARRSLPEGEAAAIPNGASVAGVSSVKDKDGKWQQVDTGYINHRTAEVERLEGRKAATSDVDTALAGSATVSKEGEKWKVDTSYIQHRATDATTIKQVSSPEPVVASSAPSASVRKESDGKWKVDTSYIGYRTLDTGNLSRKDDGNQGQQYGDPAATKYPYEALRGASNRPSDVDPTRKEFYLEDFQGVFGMAFDDYLKLPKWKQQNLKKAKDLF